VRGRIERLATEAPLHCCRFLSGQELGPDHPVEQGASVDKGLDLLPARRVGGVEEVDCRVTGDEQRLWSNGVHAG
jgi:hypothetical protein